MITHVAAADLTPVAEVESEVVIVEVVQGMRGPKGEPGDTGAPGEQGPPGEKGDKGDTGGTDISLDTSPELGGALDVKSFHIGSSTGAINIKPGSSNPKVNINNARDDYALNVRGSGLNARMSFQGGGGDSPGIELSTGITNDRRVLLRMNETGTQGAELQVLTKPNTSAGVATRLTIKDNGDATLTGNMTANGVLLSGQNLYIGPNQPAMVAGQPWMWVQTGLGENGAGFTVNYFDGVL